MTHPGMADRMVSMGIGVPLRTDGTEPCIGLTHLYFPVRRHQMWARHAVRQAQELCGRCHRTAECLRLATERGETDGVWGGVDFFVSKPHIRPSRR